MEGTLLILVHKYVHDIFVARSESILIKRPSSRTGEPIISYWGKSVETQFTISLLKTTRCPSFYKQFSGLLGITLWVSHFPVLLPIFVLLKCNVFLKSSSTGLCIDWQLYSWSICLRLMKIWCFLRETTLVVFFLTWPCLSIVCCFVLVKNNTSM